MPNSAQAQLVRQLESIATLTDEDRTQIAALPFHMKNVAQRHDVMQQGAKLTVCCLIVRGLACRYKLAHGGRRQILSLHLPGDMPDLQGLELDYMDHSIQAMSPCEVAYIPHQSMEALILGSPSLSRALRRHAAIDGSIFREWITNVGRRDALPRIGHLFCEVFTRSRALGLSDGRSFTLNLTQAEIADATGLSAVHVNRTLQALRGQHLISSRGSTHTILNVEALERVADFDAAYLHLLPPRAALMS